MSNDENRAPTDWRGLCEELTEYLALLGDPPHELVCRAQEALAQPEPEVVVPSDEELDAWITECADATRYGPLEHYWAFDVQFDHVRDIARAVLARWGRPAPAPAEGEVADLVAWLRRHASAQEAAGTHWAGQLARAAALLERQAAPVPVSLSERLPGAEDCDAEGRCWLFSKVEKEWRLIDAGNPGVPHLKYCFSHLLPAHALPLPVATPAGQEGA